MAALVMAAQTGRQAGAEEVQLQSDGGAACGVVSSAVAVGIVVLCCCAVSPAGDEGGGQNEWHCRRTGFAPAGREQQCLCGDGGGSSGSGGRE